MGPNRTAKSLLIDAKIMRFLTRNQRHGFVRARTIMKFTGLSEWPVERRLAEWARNGTVEKRRAFRALQPTYEYRLRTVAL